jgi:hypothetical protein
MPELIESVADGASGLSLTNLATTLASAAPCRQYVVARTEASVDVNSSPRVAHGRKPSKRKFKWPSEFPLTYRNADQHSLGHEVGRWIASLSLTALACRYVVEDAHDRGVKFAFDSPG